MTVGAPKLCWSHLDRRKTEEDLDMWQLTGVPYSATYFLDDLGTSVSSFGLTWAVQWEKP